jgi:transcriptional regulator with XRE-family HTH domain
MLLRAYANEVRDARLTSGLSQDVIARRIGWSVSKISRLESASSKSTRLIDAVILADAVGLELSVKAYPGTRPTRDAPQARSLHRLLAHVGKPLEYRLEAPLPAKEGSFERRAWDALLTERGTSGGQTGLELEQRLYDVQAQTRRALLKWRDGGVERLLLVIADTRGNRRVVDEFPDYFRQIPRLRTAAVIRLLEAGTRPPTGFVFF